MKDGWEMDGGWIKNGWMIWRMSKGWIENGWRMAGDEYLDECMN